MAANKRPKRKRTGSKALVVTRQIFGHLARIFVTLFLVGVITGCVVVTAITIYVMNFMETDEPINLDNVSMAETTIFYANDENGVQTEVYRMAADENRIEVTIDQIPQCLIDAYVCTEDKRFYEHDGVDWIRTVRVTVNALLRGGSQGGSTITQQLVKNITKDDDVTPVRKIREIFRAIQLERQYTKDEILEKYLNIIFLGGRNRGVEAASQAYFGCHVWELTTPQAASLAGMTRSPNSWRPDLYPEKNKDRRNYALRCMYEQGKLTEEEYKKYCAEPVVTVDSSQVTPDPSTTQTAQGVTSYYTDAVIEEVIADLMEANNWSREYASDRLRQGGYRIYMNVDAKLQKIVEEKFLDWQTFSPNELSPNANDETPEAAFVIMDYEGKVLALVGGKGEKTQSRSFNRATMAAGHPDPPSNPSPFMRRRWNTTSSTGPPSLWTAR